jgi:hypothetical protein
VEWGVVALNFNFYMVNNRYCLSTESAAAMFQESGQSQIDLMSDEVMGGQESTQAMDDDKSPSCGDDDDYNGLLCLILPLIYSIIMILFIKE